MPRYFLTILLTCLLTPLTSGQEYRGTILGHITDPSGASIIGASIEVTNVETETKVGTTSNEAGNFRVPFLLPGDYAVHVEHSGFKAMERRGIRVSTGSDVTVNLTMSLGSVSDSVTVTAAAPLLNTTGADLGQVVENAYVRNVDFAMTRNVGTLVHLSPGVTGSPQTRSHLVLTRHH